MNISEKLSFNVWHALVGTALCMLVLSPASGEIGPAYPTDDTGGWGDYVSTSYTIECWQDESALSTPITPIDLPRNACIVIDLADDGAIATYRIVGPLATRIYREQHLLCVHEKKKVFKTYEFTPQGRAWFGLGRKQATIGTAYCLDSIVEE